MYLNKLKDNNSEDNCSADKNEQVISNVSKETSSPGNITEIIGDMESCGNEVMDHKLKI